MPTPAEHDDRPPPPTAAQRANVLVWATAAYFVAVVYASLAPFQGWQAAELTILDWPKYLTTFDVLINVMAYVPLGALLVSWRHQYGARSWPALLIWTLVIGGGASLILELTQTFLPGRVSSPVDVLANTAGSVIGGLLVIVPSGQRLIRAMSRMRARYCSSHPFTDWGLLVLALWLFAQLNPAIPFFEAGLLAAPEGANEASSAASYDPLILLPQAVGVALNVTAFSLFVSLLMRSGSGPMLPVAAILILGTIAKLTMAAMLLKTPQLVTSLSPATVIGLTSGLLLFTLFSSLTYRWRAFWATILVFAGGVMAKLSSVYAALDQALRLFNWPYGQLANFTNLTRWLNEIWPLLALVFLACVFISNKAESR